MTTLTLRATTTLPDPATLAGRLAMHLFSAGVARAQWNCLTLEARDRIVRGSGMTRTELAVATAYLERLAT
jgi:hypothetical protein